MLIIALVLAAIGLAALVFAVVTSNAIVAWVCIGASLLGVLLLIVDALRERRRQGAGRAAEPVADESPTASDDDVDGDRDVVVDDAAETAEAADAVDALDQVGSEAVDETAEEPATQPAD